MSSLSLGYLFVLTSAHLPGSLEAAEAPARTLLHPREAVTILFTLQQMLMPSLMLMLNKTMLVMIVMLLMLMLFVTLLMVKAAGMAWDESLG